MRTPGNNKGNWLGRLWAMWQGSLRLRLSVGMAVIITLGMTLVATYRLIEIRRSVEDAAQARALAVSRTFAMMGAAAVLDNLFRIQEALIRYAQDADIVGIVLIALVFVGPKTPWGLIGLVPLATGALGFCPLYRLIGVSTCSSKRAT